jgi:Ubiquitin-like modifier-activating enzyme ATG7 N-terminus
MFDPCHLPLTPGWPLRNALLLAAARWRVGMLRVLCVRDNATGRACRARSFIQCVQLPSLPAGWPAGADTPSAVGWEAGDNSSGRLLPRCAFLGWDRGQLVHVCVYCCPGVVCGVVEGGQLVHVCGYCCPGMFGW